MQNDNPFKEDVQFVGAHLPRQIAERITLLCLYYSTTKSAILQTAVEKLLEHEDDEDIMVQGLAEALFNKLFSPAKRTKSKTRKPSADYEVIKKRVLPTLIRKKVPDKYINALLKAIQDQILRTYHEKN